MLVVSSLVSLLNVDFPENSPLLTRAQFEASSNRGAQRLLSPSQGFHRAGDASSVEGAGSSCGAIAVFLGWSGSGRASVCFCFLRVRCSRSFISSIYIMLHHHPNKKR